MAALPRVTIIILCYNGLDLTRACLESLRRLDYPNADVLVVDNASSDGTPAAVRAAFPEARVLEAGANLGYAEGNNAGLRAALAEGAEAAFLVNNDTLLEPDCLSQLVQAAGRYPRAGILGPMVYTWGLAAVISSAGGQVDWRRADARNVGAGELDQGQYPARRVDFVNGCGLFITRAALEAVGLLDARFYMYWEETDWCRRAARAGFEVRFEPGARMRHKAPIHYVDLSPLTLYYTTRNRLLFFARHAPLAQRPLVLGRAISGILTGTWKHWRAGRTAYVNVGPLAVWHALQGRWGPLSPAARQAQGW